MHVMSTGFAFSDFSTWPLGLVFYVAAMAAVLGAALASFLGVVCERAPLGHSIGGRSRCACGRELRAHELVPVLYWLYLALFRQGRARCCGAKVPAYYGVTEMVLAADFAAALFFFGPGAMGFLMCFIGVVVVIAWDLRYSIGTAIPGGGHREQSLYADLCARRRCR